MNRRERIGGPRNVVVILADDVGWGDLSCYGARRVSTPCVDQLARDGIRFTDAHAPSSVCTPSRYSMLTGEYAWRRPDTFILPGDAGLVIDTDCLTLPRMLKQAGYTTGVVGKWHLGVGPGPEKTDWNREIVPGPREVGFDYSFLIPATGDRVPCVFVENQRVVGLDPADPIRVSYKQNFPGEPDGVRDRETLRMDWCWGHNQAIVNGIGRIGYMTGGKAALWKDEDIADTLAGKAAAFIERNKDRPFFLYFATHDIHVPRVPHPRFVGKTGMGPRGDAIVQFDFQVGAVMEALKRHGLADDTLVILSSDNGPELNDGYCDEAVERVGDHRPAGGHRGQKFSTYEGGHRVPFIVSWPRRIRKTGTTSGALVSLVDLVASFASLVGEVLPDAAAPDSFDVAEAFLDPEKGGRDVLVTQDPLLALRVGKWKFIPAALSTEEGRELAPELRRGDWARMQAMGRPDDPVPPGALTLGDPDCAVRGVRDLGAWNIDQLYDVVKDPRETGNLAADYPDRVVAMRRMLDAARAMPTRLNHLCVVK